MIRSNPLSFGIFLFVNRWLRPIQLCILSFSICMYILLTEHVQTIRARFIGALIAAIYLLFCASMLNCDTYFCTRLFWLCSWYKPPRWSALCCLRFRKLCMYFWSQLWCWSFICLCDLVVVGNTGHRYVRFECCLNHTGWKSVCLIYFKI